METCYKRITFDITKAKHNEITYFKLNYHLRLDYPYRVGSLWIYSLPALIMKNQKKEVRVILNTRVKPSIKKKAVKKAEDSGTNISRIVETKLLEYIS